jgi:hypothetical protein
LPVDNNWRTAYGWDWINWSEALVASSVIRSQLSEIQVA